MTAGCLQVSVEGNGGQTTSSASSTGSSTAGGCFPACGANATCNPDGTCSCYLNYENCPLDDGGTACVDPLLDDANCGECGIVCPYGEDCLGATCQCHLTTCPVGDAGETVCTDPASDPNNCGGCQGGGGMQCPTGENCVLGECTCMPSLTIAQCTTDAGLVCVDLTRLDQDGGDPCGWEMGCDDCGPPDADAGGGCCSGTCADFTLDPYNCGACGNVCISGSCILDDAGTGICNCPLPYSWCGPLCVDTYTDYNHCGGCTACTSPATQCVQGNCQ
jgi:hypothetical protein